MKKISWVGGVGNEKIIFIFLRYCIFRFLPGSPLIASTASPTFEPLPVIPAYAEPPIGQSHVANQSGVASSRLARYSGYNGFI